MGAGTHLGPVLTTPADWGDVDDEDGELSTASLNGSWWPGVSSGPAVTPSVQAVWWWDERQSRTSPPSTCYHLVTGTLLITWAVLATLGNAVVLLVLGRRRRRPPIVGSQSPTTDAFILNLAITHLLLSLLCTPLEAATAVLGGRWVFGDGLCRVFFYLSHVFVSAAVVTLTDIAIDRYYLVVYPLKRKITTFKRRLIIGLTWGYALLICIPILPAVRVTKNALGTSQCHVGWPLWLSQVLMVGWTTLTIFLPLTVSCVAYYLVWRAFRLSQLKVNVARVLKVGRGAAIFSTTELRLLKTLLLMIFCYVALWTPYLTYLFLWFFSDVQIPRDFIMTSMWISRVQPVLDPLIYGYLNDQFRRGLCDMVGGGATTFCAGWQDDTPTTVNEEPLGNFQEGRSRSMFESNYRHAAPPLPPPVGHVPTVTCHNGQTHAQTVHDELFLSMDAYIRRTSYPLPRISRVSVKELTDVSRTPAQAMEDEVVVGSRSHGKNMEDHVLELQQIPRRQDPLRLSVGIGPQTTGKETQRKQSFYPTVLVHSDMPAVLQKIDKPRKVSGSRINVVCPAPLRDGDQCSLTSGPSPTICRLPPITSQRGPGKKTPASAAGQEMKMFSVPVVGTPSGKQSMSNGVGEAPRKHRRKRRKILSKRLKAKESKGTSNDAAVKDKQGVFASNSQM